MRVSFFMLSLIGACSGGEFPETDAAVSPFTATIEVVPADEIEVGQPLTLTVSIFHDGELITDATPEVEFDGPVAGSIEVSPGEVAGTFVGTHTFTAAGTYTVSVHFTADGADREARVPLVVRAGH